MNALNDQLKTLRLSHAARALEQQQEQLISHANSKQPTLIVDRCLSHNVKQISYSISNNNRDVCYNSFKPPSRGHL